MIDICKENFACRYSDYFADLKDRDMQLVRIYKFFGAKVHYIEAFSKSSHKHGIPVELKTSIVIFVGFNDLFELLGGEVGHSETVVIGHGDNTIGSHQ